MQTYYIFFEELHVKTIVYLSSVIHKTSIHKRFMNEKNHLWWLAHSYTHSRGQRFCGGVPRGKGIYVPRRVDLTQFWPLITNVLCLIWHFYSLGFPGFVEAF